MNPFMGAGAMAMTIDEFNGDNFDHGPLGFVGGAYVQTQMVGGAPIRFHPTPRGTPKWGLQWKHAVAKHYNHSMTINASGSNMSWRNNYLSLDPTYRDAAGLPLLRMTFDFHDNDIRMSAFVTAKMEEIAKATGAAIIEANPRKPPYTSVAYQSTHLNGGLPMSATPADGAVNRYCQSWDVPNLFVMGASVFPQNVSYNPTATLAAVAYWSAQAIVEQYLKAPGAMVTI
jgi:gluconate 2-dehydrogenase alpha chain